MSGKHLLKRAVSVTQNKHSSQMPCFCKSQPLTHKNTEPLWSKAFTALIKQETDPLVITESLQRVDTGGLRYMTHRSQKCPGTDMGNRNEERKHFWISNVTHRNRGCNSPHNCPTWAAGGWQTDSNKKLNCLLRFLWQDRQVIIPSSRKISGTFFVRMCPQSYDEY